MSHPCSITLDSQMSCWRFIPAPIADVAVSRIEKPRNEISVLSSSYDEATACKYYAVERQTLKEVSTQNYRYAKVLSGRTNPCSAGAAVCITNYNRDLS